VAALHWFAEYGSMGMSHDDQANGCFGDQQLRGPFGLPRGGSGKLTLVHGMVAE
jgi:hypothetical protein